MVVVYVSLLCCFDCMARAGYGTHGKESFPIYKECLVQSPRFTSDCPYLSAMKWVDYKRLFPGLLCALLLAGFGQAGAQTRAPKFSNEFLSIGLNARGLGMAGTQVALSNDVTAAYWNPAGLSRLGNTYEVSLMHAEYFGGIGLYDYAGFASRLDANSAIGISLIRFGVDDIPDTRFLYDANGAINYDNIRFFSAADYAGLLSYARVLPGVKNLRVGGNVKIVHRIAGSFATAWGFGLDLGAQYKAGPWQLGLSIYDATGTFNAWSHSTELLADVFLTTGNELPESSLEVTLPRATLGVARDFSFGESLTLLAAFDALLSFDGERNVLIGSDLVSVDPRLGLEWGYKEKIYLRMGAGRFQQVRALDGSERWEFRPDAGLGVQLGDILRLDYALTDLGDQSSGLYSHVFSVLIAFDKKEASDD